MRPRPDPRGRRPRAGAAPLAALGAALVLAGCALPFDDASPPSDDVVLDGRTPAGSGWRLLVHADPDDGRLCTTFVVETGIVGSCDYDGERLGVRWGRRDAAAPVWWVSGAVDDEVVEVEVRTGRAVTRLPTVPSPDPVAAGRRFFILVDDGALPEELAVRGLDAEGDLLAEEPVALP